MSVVVLTKQADPTADLVVTELQHRDVPVFRADLAEFPQQLSFTARLANRSRFWTGALCSADRTVNFSEVSGVWYRKPSAFAMPAGMTATDSRWAAAEAKVAFGGVLPDLPGVRWINPPYASAAAEPRPRQLDVAAACGLTVPDTVITNVADAAREFCREHAKHGVIYKPLTSAPQGLALYATPITAEDITDEITHTAHLLQARVLCAYSARIVAVDGSLFATRIDAPGRAVDWRCEHDQLTYTPVEIPPQVQTGLLDLMSRFDLVFSSSDWIISPDGTWTFLGDLNPTGQWAWIPHLREPVTHALADTLTGKDAS